MQIRDRVRYSRQLVEEFDQMTESCWERMESHHLYHAFMREYLAAKCVLDLWWFMRFGVYTNAMQHYYEPLHGPNGVAGYLQDWTREDVNGVKVPVSVKFLIMAREHCKTQMAIAWDAWMFTRDPNWRLLVRAYTDPKAAEILGAVRGLLDSEQYKRNFPWVRPALKKNSSQPLCWREDRFMLQRDDIGVRVPSAEAVGMDGDPTGGHFLGGHYDDFEVAANANSDVLLAKLFSTFKNDSNLFMAGAKRVCCGTPWGRNGIIISVKDRKGEMADHQFGVLSQPCTIQVFKEPFFGEEPVLLGDRMTVRDSNAGFPTIEANLTLCQATLRFFSPAARDYVEEVREVVWNDGTHFRVNRPFPEMLGQPIWYKVGNHKPAAPNRFTLDSVDIDPPEDSNNLLIRKSLVQKKIEQGSAVFSAQMELNPADPEAMMLNPEHLKIIRVTPDEDAPEKCFPDGPKRWFRTTDLSSDKHGTAYTAITTGFFHETGVYIAHIVHERTMNATDIILELLTGVIRVERWKGHLEWTSFEKALLENQLHTFLKQAEKDPVGFFRQMGGKYIAEAQKFDTDSYRNGIRVLTRILSRPNNMDKPRRVVSQQPMWEAGKVHVIVGPGFVREACLDALVDEAKFFTLEGKSSFDLLDNLHDLIAEGSFPRKAQERKQEPGYFTRVNREAALANSLRRHMGVVGTGWPPRN